MKSQLLFDTKRLSVRPLALGDGKFILELVNTPGWISFIGDRKVHSESDAVDYIRKIIDTPGINYWSVRIKEKELLIGVISLVKRDYLAHYDIGFAFLPEYENNGYAFESASALLQRAFNSFGHSQILSITIPQNSRSIRLLRKLGLEFQEEIEIEKEKLQVFEISADRFSINENIQSFYSALSNKGKKSPDLDIVKEISLPEITIINQTKLEAYVFNLPSFLEARRRVLTDGTLLDYEMREMVHETKIIKNVAIRFSEYEKRGLVFRQRFNLGGYKIFQLAKIKGSWKICSLLWVDNEE